MDNQGMETPNRDRPSNRSESFGQRNQETDKPTTREQREAMEEEQRQRMEREAKNLPPESQEQIRRASDHPDVQTSGLPYSDPDLASQREENQPPESGISISGDKPELGRPRPA